MFGVLVVLFLLLPLAELYVIIQVGQAIGALNTIVVLILLSAVGVWLVKREGMSVWSRFQRQVGAGSVPGKEIADGVMILFAGALLMTPGFLTDLLALSLLLPPVRAAVRGTVMARAARRGGIIRARRFDA
ncbi:MAG: FxsA family protein [Acidimicrobiales bacterium]